MCAAAVTFASVFGWSYYSWRAVIDSHNRDLDVCTKLLLLPTNATGVSIAFVDGVECQLVHTLRSIAACNAHKIV